MPTSISKVSLRALALDLAWSLWAELGVSGWTRRHRNVALDLEPLIIATAYLGALDSRLLEESFDWCVTNARFISAVRLKNLLPSFELPVKKAFGSFAAAVKKHRSVSWPGDGKPLRVLRTGRSTIPDLHRPALVQLRLRAVFGVSARAEIVKRMLPEPDRPFGVSELAMYTAYGKDNLSDALDLLSLAGFVSRNVMTKAGNVYVFQSSAAGRLSALLGELPARDGYPYWAARFRVLLALIYFAEGASTDAAVRAAEIQRFTGQMKLDLRWLTTYPRLRRGVDAVNEDFDKWAFGLLRRWAGTTVDGD